MPVFWMGVGIAPLLRPCDALSHIALKMAGPNADDVLVLNGFHSLQHSGEMQHLSVTIDEIGVGSTAIDSN